MKTVRGFLLVLLALPTALLADTVYLKGGGKVSGRIVSRTETEVEVDVGAGTIRVGMANVERIVEERSALDDYAQRAAALGPQDVEGWRELGRWAASHGLNTQARQAYERVIALAPNDREANEAMGQVQVDGHWMSEEESYRSRGYVKFEGEWMTPAERDAISRSRSATAEADQRVREAEARAREAEARAREAESATEEAEEGIPLYWGWGTGPAAWPGTTHPIGPTTLPARVPR